MNIFFITIFVAIGLLVGLLALLETGRRLSQRRLLKEGEGSSAGLGALNGAVFGLMGLLVAFTFSSAASKFDARRVLITEEANMIGTAWLRLDLLPVEAQTGLREYFRTYLDARLAAYAALPDIAAAKAHLDRSTKLQNQIWTTAVAATKGDQRATMLLLPALNQMIDITSTRLTAAQTHPPPIIYVLLIVVTLACALLAGYGMSGQGPRNWLHMLAFAVILALSIYVILDLEYPRMGLIRIDAADEILVQLRQSMN